MSKLFPFNVPFCETENELDKIKKQFKDLNLDEYFLVSSALEERKDFFDSLYEVYEPYSDEGFLKDVQIQFHQRSWEMYLGAMMFRNKKNYSYPQEKITKLELLISVLILIRQFTLSALQQIMEMVRIRFLN